MRHHEIFRDVSRETFPKIEAFADLVQRWNRKINLVADASTDQLWQRHIADSAQLLDHLPDAAKTWIDLGSGGGFPALVCAIALGDQSPHLTLLESDQRKAVFLREAIRVTGANAGVKAHRIEAIPPEPYDLVTARALAPLPKLLAYAEKFCQDGTVLLLPKGKSASSELTQARVDWHMDVDTLPSRTDSEATIFRIRGLERRI